VEFFCDISVIGADSFVFYKYPDSITDSKILHSNKNNVGTKWKVCISDITFKKLTKLTVIWLVKILMLKHCSFLMLARWTKFTLSIIAIRCLFWDKASKRYVLLRYCLPKPGTTTAKSLFLNVHCQKHPKLTDIKSKNYTKCKHQSNAMLFCEEE
jgi:hypothetical protein